GATGPTGSTGPTGATGPTGPGGVIPFASGGTVTINSLLTGVPNTGAIIAFGNSTTSVGIGNATVNLQNISNEAFVVPRAGAITNVAAFFNITVALSIAILGTATITAQVWKSQNASSNVFAPLASTLISFTPLAGAIAAFTTLNGAIANLNEPVNVGDRLIMVFSVATTGLSVITAITGTASAGITIS
ncbi:exosporium glycoprotein BclB-related protein, partial [Viridibacillus arvi]